MVVVVVVSFASSFFGNRFGQALDCGVLGRSSLGHGDGG